jgi:hemoglobin
MKYLRTSLLITLLVLFLAASSAVAEDETPSLYERLGGLKPISLVVDDFIDRLVTNETLNANPAIAAGRDSSPAPYLKVQLSVMVCQATGGPCDYTGLGMKESHSHLNITESEWQVMLDEFKKSLDKFGVPEAEQKELFAIIESTKADIVVTE